MKLPNIFSQQIFFLCNLSSEEAASQDLKEKEADISSDDKSFSNFFEKEEDAPNDEENKADHDLDEKGKTDLS